MRHSALNVLRSGLAFGLLATTSLAQNSFPCGVTALGAAIFPSKTNTPFSATVETTHDQQFVDGNAIHGIIVTHTYRDSAGRTRQETSVMCGMGLDGQFRPTINVTVSDPAKHTTMSWQIDGRDKVAHLHHQEEQPTSTAAPLTQEQRTLNALIQQNWRKNTQSENLGARSIAGVSCEDTRQTTTIPAGQQGNELPMQSKEEVCIARDIGVSMLRVSDFPLSGHTQTEITNFTPGEPDPSVFSPPPGYAIEEQPLKLASAVSAQ